MRNKVVFILLDAFRGDYINHKDTPFLFSKIREGVFARRLRTTPGFTQRTAIFTGTKPDKSGMFTMFTFDEDNSPFKFLRNKEWSRKIDKSENESKLRRSIRKEAEKNSFCSSTAHIPIKMLSYVGLSEDDKQIHQPGAYREESIFDIFDQKEISYQFLMWPVINCNDYKTLKKIKDDDYSDKDIILIHFSDTDREIHKCGPMSDRRHKITREMDRKVEKCYEKFKKQYNFVIAGDHGMTDVKEEIDILEILKKCEQDNDVSRYEDYIVFLDSTMARFRAFTDAGEKFLRELKNLPLLYRKGKFLNKDIAKRFSIPLDKKYGDLIWLAHPGVLIFPDYFHNNNNHNKGMHGYVCNDDDMKSFFLAFGPDIKPNLVNRVVELVDLCPTICRLLNVRPPKNNEGVSLI